MKIANYRKTYLLLLAHTWTWHYTAIMCSLFKKKKRKNPLWYSQKRCQGIRLLVGAAGSPVWTDLWCKCSLLPTPLGRWAHRSGDQSAVPSSADKHAHPALHTVAELQASTNDINRCVQFKWGWRDYIYLWLIMKNSIDHREMLGPA